MKNLLKTFTYKRNYLLKNSFVRIKFLYVFALLIIVACSVDHKKVAVVQQSNVLRLRVNDKNFFKWGRYRGKISENITEFKKTNDTAYLNKVISLCDSGAILVNNDRYFPGIKILVYLTEKKYNKIHMILNNQTMNLFLNFA